MTRQKVFVIVIQVIQIVPQYKTHKCHSSILKRARTLGDVADLEDLCSSRFSRVLLLSTADLRSENASETLLALDLYEVIALSST